MSDLTNFNKLLENSQIKPYDRMMELLSTDNPLETIQSLNPADFYMLVHDVGLSDATDLLAYATGEQFQVCLDFETWRGDQFEESKLIPWVDALVSLEDHDFERIFYESDPETLAFFLHKNVTIYAPENKDDAVDLPDEEGKITRQSPDLTYWITYPDTGDASDALQALVNKCYTALGVERAWSYIESMNWELCTDLLEKMYYFRSKRLEDYGFFSQEESSRIFKIQNPEQLRIQYHTQLDADLYSNTPRDYSPFVKALIPITKENLNNSLYFNQIFENLDDNTRSQITSQLVALGQAVAVCDRVEPSDFDSMTESFQYALQLTSVGLEFLAKNSNALAERFLQKIPVRAIFNAGYNLTYQLGETFKAILKRGNLSILDGEPMSLLNQEQRDTIQGLLEERPRPRYASLENFKKLRDVEEASMIIADIAFQELFFFGILKLSLDDIKRIAYDYELLNGIENLNFYNLALTFFVQKARGLKQPWTPFDADEPCPQKDELLKALSHKSLENTLPNFATDTMKISFERMIKQLKMHIESEIQTENPDPRFISILLFAED